LQALQPSQFLPSRVRHRGEAKVQPERHLGSRQSAQPPALQGLSWNAVTSPGLPASGDSKQRKPYSWLCTQPTLAPVSCQALTIWSGSGWGAACLTAGASLGAGPCEKPMRKAAGQRSRPRPAAACGAGRRAAAAHHEPGQEILIATW
jgi:hypothetical protein